MRALALRHVLANRTRLRLALAMGRLYSRSGVQALIRGPLGRVLPARLRRLESSLPALNETPFRETGTLAAPVAAEGTPRRRVALLLGCIHGEMYPRMHQATVTALAHVGCEVVAPPEQVCCGALHVHAGDAETARALARRNIAAFEAAEVDAVIVNAAGCGAVMKEYGRLLRHDPNWRERAERFASNVRDVLEFVAEQDFARDLGEVDRTVTLQDACHLAHAQRIREAPRTILRAIPGVTFTEMRNPDRCCGSAGIYSVVQADMSAQVLEAKMETIAATSAGTVCTANPGCTLQIEAGTRRHDVDAEVRHVIEVLAESIEAGARSSSR